MAYAVEADLTKYFGEEQLLIAADRDADGTADTDVISTALEAAEDEIDSYVGVRYDIPLASVPGVLKRICCDLAMYHMSVDQPSMTEVKEKKYNDGIAWLTKLATGKVTLGAEESDNNESVNDVAEVSEVTSTNTSSRLFTRSSLSGLF